jgi:hypothetical protein
MGSFIRMSSALTWNKNSCVYETSGMSSDGREFVRNLENFFIVGLHLVTALCNAASGTERGRERAINT